VFSLGLVQETPGSIICDSLSEKVRIITFCIDELTTNPGMIIVLFACQHSWYSVMADVMHLHILTENGN
jgi:hypothetical protein